MRSGCEKCGYVKPPKITGSTRLILDVLRANGAQMTYSEIVSALPDMDPRYPGVYLPRLVSYGLVHRQRRGVYEAVEL